MFLLHVKFCYNHLETLISFPDSLNPSYTTKAKCFTVFLHQTVSDVTFCPWTQTLTDLWSVSTPHTTRWWRTACASGPCQTSGWHRPEPRGSPSSRHRSGRVWTAAPAHGTSPDRSENNEMRVCVQDGEEEVLRGVLEMPQRLLDSHLMCFHQGGRTEPSLFLKSRPSEGSERGSRLSAKLETPLIRPPPT